MKDDSFLYRILESKSSDYTEYGGTVERFEHPEEYYPECKDCIRFIRLKDYGDWGVCTNPLAVRMGILTHENQSGKYCAIHGNE
jgi:hypothetical protein